MNAPDLKVLTTDNLIELFAKDAERIREVNFELVSPMDMPGRENFEAESEQLHAEINAIDKELRRRGQDARRALMRLYGYPDWKVTLEAAHYTLGVAPEAAREVIEAIAASGPLMQRMEARSLLKALDEGKFKPD